MRVRLTMDDQNKDVPAPLEFRHASIGASSFNTILSSSRLLLPVAKQAGSPMGSGKHVSCQ
jgi:hypothetical protein